MSLSRSLASTLSFVSHWDTSYVNTAASVECTQQYNIIYKVNIAMLLSSIVKKSIFRVYLPLLILQTSSVLLFVYVFFALSCLPDVECFVDL